VSLFDDDWEVDEDELQRQEDKQGTMKENSTANLGHGR
jgi:hypothetical protein